jgi:3-oxoacyl-(acyl-carrier-protein) synthase
MTRIAITGMGIISPYGVGAEPLWEQVIAGHTAVKELTGFPTEHLQCRIGGQLSNFQARDYISPRLARKIDRFSTFGVTACLLALRQAGLLRDNHTAVWQGEENGGHRVGITVGNNLGGWEFAERELRNLWALGPRDVSPYIAAAWFPAAAQGNISISFGIKGVGRTFISERASSALALLHAADTLTRRRADIMLAGGTEAPLSPYAGLFYEKSGQISRQASHGSPASYRPFDKDADGLVVGEGAAFFVLERAEDARARGASILAELTGWASTNDGFDPVHAAPDGRRYAAAMTRALERANMTPMDVDCVFAAGSALPEEDLSETRALHLALGEMAPHVPVTAPKAAFGNLFGAAHALDLALAILSLQAGLIPPTLNLDEPAPGCDLDYVSQSARPANQLSHCLVNARGIGGANASVVVCKAEA